jgi:hypothetical protein
MSPIQNCLAKLLAQWKKFQQLAKFYQKQLSTALYTALHSSLHSSLLVSHLHCRSIRLDLRSYQLTTTFCPLAALLPSTSPHQYNGEIPAAKMTANKQKTNLKNMPCSDQ